MPGTNAEAIKRLLAAWNRGDIERMLSEFDPECEVRFRPHVPEPGPFHGRTELGEWIEGFRAAWGSTHAELGEVVAENADCIVVLLRLTGEGAESAIAIDLDWFNLFEFRGGKIVRWRDFDQRAAALDAAGLA